MLSLFTISSHGYFKVHVFKIFSETLDPVCLESRATHFEIVNYIVYYRRGGEKTRSDTVVYKLLDYFRWVELRMAQIACDFVRLIGQIRLLSSSFGLGGHFRKNQYWFSAVSLIFIEPGTSWRVNFSRSDISRYAPVFFPLRINDFNCFLLRNPMNFNCFFRHFNCVNTQIRSLIRVLPGHQVYIFWSLCPKLDSFSHFENRILLKPVLKVCGQCAHYSTESD